MDRILHIAWAIVAICALGLMFHVQRLNQELRLRVTLLERIGTLEATRCAGVHKVNALCETTIIDLTERLGLDTGIAPLLTATMQRRSIGGIGGE